MHLNDVAAIESVAYLIQFDSVHGTWAPRVTAGPDGIITISEGDRKLEVPYSCCKKLEELRAVQVF